MTESQESTENKEKHPHGFGLGMGNGLPYCGIHKVHPMECFDQHHPESVKGTKNASALLLETSITHVLKQRDNGTKYNSEAQRGDGTQTLESPGEV